MHEAHHFLLALTTVLGVAAVTTVLFQKLRQPVVLGYLLAGLVVGPHVPIPLVADPAVVETLSELGVVLLMFALGLEFRLRKLIEVGGTAGITAFIQCSLMVWLGFVAGRALGWTTRESMFAGSLVAISSTTIIAKAFAEAGIGGRLRELVVGVLIVEDLIAVLLMALLTAIVTGAGLSATALGSTIARLDGFLIAYVVIGLLVVPRVVRAVVKLNRPETTVITAVAVCFGGALLAAHFGYSVALGAFIAGTLVAESGEGKRIEHLIQPVRDVFAAVFFVSVGMMIDPKLMVGNAGAIALFTVVVIVGKLVGVTLGAFLTGNGTRLSIQAGMSLAQIGEFSFIIAGLGRSLGATRPFLYPVAVAVSAITTLTTPWLIRAAGPVASFVDRKLPHPMQTFAALYGSWIEKLRTQASAPSLGRRLRRRLLLLLVDAAVVAVLVLVAGRSERRVALWVAGHWGLPHSVASTAVLVAAGLATLPFVLGIIRSAFQLGTQLAEVAIPQRQGPGVDLADAPRRALRVTLQAALLLGTLLPVLAVTQPVVPHWFTFTAVVVLLILAGVRQWRSTRNLEGHVRAGAEVLVELLARQSAEEKQADHHPTPAIGTILPGMGSVTFVELPAGCAVSERTLGELNLRGVTGATVLAIRRKDGAVATPGPKDVLRPGDVLALAGSDEAIASARALLTHLSPAAA